ncbi:F-box/kelch-repeat protein At3g23880-like [Prosopis cineraria]|uniref:F-box/kelch-repeat protein At3g23880-like n=1 Tax=Prosopis cineraria TaxID=364024 RepID=UPI00240EB92A|nr:F-box/kelch-repeat protein At3g23880-like [Prosopis cineraria]
MKPPTKADLPFLPSEIMAEIFKRLPVRILTQFQCVCKDWKILIKNLFKTPSFIQDHLHHSGNRNPSLLLEQYHRRIRGIRLSVLDYDKQVHKVQESLLTNLRFNVDIVGSSNGLVCGKIIFKSTIYHHPLLVWNPMTREARKVLPKTIIDSELVDFVGFGFSPLDNDYKIVRIIVDDSNVIKPIEVYSLKCGSWKKIEFGNLLKGIRMSSGSVTVNGVMFWFARWFDDIDTILLVDLSKEVCTYISSMPYINFFSPRRLVKYENKLAVIANNIEGIDQSNRIHLWVMEEDRQCASKDDSERWRWTKIYTSEPYQSKCKDLNPVTIWGNEIVLLPYDQVENRDGKTTTLYLLNLITNEFKKIAARAYTYNYYQTRKRRPFYYNGKNIEIDIFNYVESLVSVGNINIEEH